MQNEMKNQMMSLFHDLSINCEQEIGCIRCEYNRKSECKTERKVDYLLANGVIVPPCHVGEKIYFIDKDTNKIEEDEVKFFTVTKDGVLPILKWHNRKCWKYYEWGKNVFVNIEEAKKVLKEKIE